MLFGFEGGNVAQPLKKATEKNINNVSIFIPAIARALLKVTSNLPL